MRSGNITQGTDLGVGVLLRQRNKDLSISFSLFLTTNLSLSGHLEDTLQLGKGIEDSSVEGQK
jgi:hypothetical protein